MLLTVNVGNTHTGVGVFQGTRLLQVFSVPTRRDATPVAWKQSLAKGLKALLPGPWEGVVAAGVVPEVKLALTHALEVLIQTRIYWLTARSSFPIINNYQPAAALGLDRLLNAVAAVQQTGAPVIVVDAGTAITLDVVDARRRFVGGAILPGFHTAMYGLVDQTSQLSWVTLTPPKRLIGRSTEEGLNAGIIAGTGAAVAVLLAEMRRELGVRTKIVGTGGSVDWLLPYCPAIQDVRPHLTHEGLRIAWLFQAEKRRA